MVKIGKYEVDTTDGDDVIRALEAAAEEVARLRGLLGEVNDCTMISLRDENLARRIREELDDA